jgi:hypothetical protein
MRPPLPPTSLAVLAAVVLTVGCSSSDEQGDLPVSGTRPAEATAPPASPAPTGPAATGTTVTGDAGGDQPEIIELQVPTEVSCSGVDVEVSLTYRTADADQVAFVVDQQSVQGGPDPAVSGTYAIRVPCDDTAHTVLMAAVGPGGQAVASRAFRTVPAPG